MIPYIGDFRLGDVVEHWIGSDDGAGNSITMAVNGSLRLYKAGSTAELATVVSLTEDFDSVVGVHRISLQLSGAGVTPAADYVVVIVGAGINGATVNTPLFTFSCQNRGTWVSSRGTFAAVTANGGTLGAGTFDRVNVGDRIRVVSASRADYRVIETLDTGTGAFTLRNPWSVLPAVGDTYETHEGVQGDQIAAADIADGALTNPKFADNAITATKLDSTAIAAIQAGLAADADVAQLLVDVAAIDTDLATALSNLATLIADVDDVQARLPAALVGGKLDARLNAAGLETDAVDELVAGVFAKLIFTGYSFERIMKLVFAGVAGPSQDVDTGAPKYKSPDESQVLIDATAVLGNRSINAYGS